MTEPQKPQINIYNLDCMEGMKQMKDNAFHLAIVDPPYGININNQSQGKGGGVAKKIEYTHKSWDKVTPDKGYFDELFRVSENQIIWGANYYIDKIQRNSPCWIIWDKDNGKNDFSDCELAFTSFSSATRLFKYRWAGMLQENMKNKEKRVHPTQKPIDLYKWILENYAKPGYKILDTHLGGGSIALACWDLGYDLTAFEIDLEYYETAKKRLNQHKKQLQLF